MRRDEVIAKLKTAEPRRNFFTDVAQPDLRGRLPASENPNSLALDLRAKKWVQASSSSVIDIVTDHF
jgi:hypothetical protein